MAAGGRWAYPAPPAHAGAMYPVSHSAQAAGPAPTRESPPSAAEDSAPLGFELGQAEAVDARPSPRRCLGDGLAGAQSPEELPQRLDPTPIEKVAHDPECDVVAGASPQRIGVGSSRCGSSS